MEEKLQNLCEKFIANRDTVKRALPFGSMYLPPLCADLYCAAGKDANDGQLKDCMKIISANAGLFSYFRGTMKPAYATMLALSDAPEERIRSAQQNYALLKRDFWGSEYLALVSFLLTEHAAEEDVARNAARGKEIYRLMRKNHPLLTSSEDSVFAVLMAFSEKTNGQLADDMETAYAMLKDHISFAGNALQTVSHVLALSDRAPKETVQRVVSLYETLRGANVKYRKDYSLATLAALAVTDADEGELTARIAEVYDYLGTQKGYGVFGLGKSERAMHSAMLVSNLYTPGPQLMAAAISGTLSMIIAQEIMFCAVIAGSAASSSAGN